MSNFAICLDPAFQEKKESLTCDLPEEAYQDIVNFSEPSQDSFVPSDLKEPRVSLDLNQFHKQIHEGAFKGFSTAPARSFWEGDPWAYSGLPLFLAGCKGKSKERKPPVSSPKAKNSSGWKIETKGIRKVKVELEGDPKLGTVLFIRQVHLPPNFKEDLDFLVLIGNYQLEILRLLEQLRPQHVFTEDSDYTFSPEDLHHGDYRINDFDLKRRLQMRKLFGRRIPRDPDPRLLMGTAVARAQLVYAMRHEDVYLRRAAAPEEAHLWDDCRRLGPEASDSEFSEVCLYRRERVMVREISEFLRKHPGERVALVYGAAHNFADDFKKAGFQPRIISVWWDIPGLSDYIGESSMDNRVPGFHQESKK